MFFSEKLVCFWRRAQPPDSKNWFACFDDSRVVSKAFSMLFVPVVSSRRVLEVERVI
jgi:hypothetical protein